MAIYGIEVTIPQLVAWLGMAASVWFYGMAVYGAWDFFGHRRSEDEPADDWAPPVTLLKPLKGLDVEMYENLSTFCRQEYPAPFQLLFGVAEGSDPSVAIVRRLQREFPHLAIDLVVDARIHGTNYKVSNLMNMYARARHDILVLSDSDMRVPSHYLRRIVAPLRDQHIGLVTCLYRAIGAKRLPARIEALFINTDFCHQVLVARKVEKARYAFGASIALRREVLEAAGGFGALVDLLADDYFLGHFVADLGKSNWLSACVVDTVLPASAWKRLAQHQLRWARTFRSVRPASYFATILTHGTFWAAANLLLGGLHALPVALSAAVLGVRFGTTALLSWRYFGTQLSVGDLLLVFAKDLFMDAVWGLSFLGSTVSWSGRRFRVLRTGEMQLIGTEPDHGSVELALKQPS